MVLRVRVDVGVFAKGVKQSVTAGHGARQRSAHPDVMLTRRFATYHRVKRHELQHVDWFDPQLSSDPLDGLIADVAEVFLQQVQ